MLSPPPRGSAARRRWRGRSRRAPPACGGCWSAGSCRARPVRRGSARRRRNRAIARCPAGGAAPARTRSACVSASGAGRLITTITPAPSSAIAFIAPSSRPPRSPSSAKTSGTRLSACMRTRVGLPGSTWPLTSAICSTPEALLRKVVAVQAPPQRLSKRASAVCSTSRSLRQAIGDEVADRADLAGRGAGRRRTRSSIRAIVPSSRHDLADHARRD